MQITSTEALAIHVNHRGDWVFCLIHTDEGICGLGEASHSSNDALAVALIRQWGERLSGRDPLGIEAILATLISRHGGRVEHTVTSAIEQALWDIMGQRLGVAIRTLLGGAIRERIRLYANVNRHVRDRSPEGFARAASQAVAEGFTAVKLAPFDEVRGRDHARTGPNAPWMRGIERVRAVREAIGDQVELLVDCHGRFDEAEGMVVARALDECRLFWYEEPVPHNLTDALERITQCAPMPTASAESVYGLEGFRPFVSRHVVDVLMPDVKHCGGLLEMKQIAGAARMSGLPVAPHSPSGPVSTAASAQVVSTLRNFLILEYAWGEAEWRASLLDPPEQIKDGYLILPEGPGLGHRLNMSVVAEHRVSELTSRDSSTALPVG